MWRYHDIRSTVHPIEPHLGPLRGFLVVGGIPRTPLSTLHRLAKVLDSSSLLESWKGLRHSSSSLFWGEVGYKLISSLRSAARCISSPTSPSTSSSSSSAFLFLATFPHHLLLQDVVRYQSSYTLGVSLPPRCSLRQRPLAPSGQRHVEQSRDFCPHLQRPPI